MLRHVRVLQFQVETSIWDFSIILTARSHQPKTETKQEAKNYLQNFNGIYTYKRIRNMRGPFIKNNGRDDRLHCQRCFMTYKMITFDTHLKSKPDSGPTRTFEDMTTSGKNIKIAKTSSSVNSDQGKVVFRINIKDYLTWQLLVKFQALGANFLLTPENM